MTSSLIQTIIRRKKVQETNMPYLRKKYKDIALATAWIGVLLAIVIQDHTLSSDLETGRRIWLYTSAPIFMLTATLMLWRKGKKYNFSGWDICYTLLFIYQMAIHYIAPLSSPHKWAQTVLLLTIAYTLRIWLYENRFAKRLVSISLCLIGAFESIWAVLQLTETVPVNHHLFPLTGSFQNPGPFSGFIALLLPLALNETIQSYRYIHKINITSLLSAIPVAACLIMIVVLPAGFSRIAWMAGFAGCSAVLLLHYNGSHRILQMFEHKRKTLWGVCALGLVVLIAGGYWAYQFKKDSADGRALIWKVSLAAIQKEPIMWGKGVGSFAQEYGQAQHDYMKEGNPTQQEKMVADAPEYAFNEYFRVGVEQGVCGLILFLWIIYRLINKAIRSKKTHGVMGSLISFTIFAFASYPMSQLPFWIVLITLPALLHEDQKRKQIKQKKALPALLIALTLITMGAVWSRRTEKEDYLCARNQSETTLLEQKQTLLYYEPTVMFHYGKRLMERAETAREDKTALLEAALFYFKQGAARSCDPMFQLLQGRCNELLCNFGKAAEYYEMAHYMTPNRLYPLYRLIMLYRDNQSPIYSTEKTKYYAQKLLNTPVKINSPASEEMRDSAKKIDKGNIQEIEPIYE